MTRKQIIKEFRKFYINDINNSRKQKDILSRELLIEKILDRALWICYEINNGELEEKEFLERELNIIIDEFLEDDSNFLRDVYDIANVYTLKK